MVEQRLERLATIVKNKNGVKRKSQRNIKNAKRIKRSF